MDHTLLERWKAIFEEENFEEECDEEDVRMSLGEAKDGDGNPFWPFASELDWRVARWVVTDSPGHKATDRLLEIPGVSDEMSSLSIPI